MPKVTWSAPLVNYARCEFEFEVDQTWEQSPQEFGRQYALWLADVMRGYESGVDEIKRAKKEVTDQYEKSPEPAASVEEAKEMLEDGLGPTTEVPWEDKSVEKSEPWKNKGPVRKVKKIDF